ncbi:3-hydroxyacyl-CoA dehydrogenase [Salinibacter sp. 10B]|uniref:3-hydroxyacyl-CoA dehydrogenase/enoyl-CoA hydratase family protein n=1 Tax=Salinibacter sp. 10B TaxID=1923971 RepID=UPI000CF50A54|nr:3-hydroxyacyl-CoA dehydrogenase/enoyl-CoA hydratase family protein [Salinibacter sp. 10B]PQJ35839.1 3-hydroxyacyl-CoA dehydrogenase [Salinibacter sp. 10B]
METKALDTRSLHLSAPATHPPFRTAAVLGAGTMGAQIAAHLANAGLEVHLLDITPDHDDDPNAVVKKGFEQAREASPDPFFTDDVADRIYLGNFQGDFERVSEVDWVVEAVLERMDVKRDVHARIEEHASDDAVISTNTSGLPIHEIAEERSDGFKQRFLGTHFFNPPRYMKLLELVPTPRTDPSVLERVAQFGRLHLGKSVVVANDVPYFIGNRIGVFAQLQALRYYTDGDYTIEEIDTLTGQLVGHPKSATFRTADLVGLDVLTDVANNLYDKVEDDERREAFQVPDVMQRLVEEGRLGEKTKEGFYKKVDDEIKSLDPETFEYTSAEEEELGDLKSIKKAGGLDDRLQALYQDTGRAGTFFRETTLELLGYSARRIGEITANPADVDRAIRWGFNWEKGPFEMWDALGFETVLNGMEEHGIEVPEWVEAMQSRGHTQFYRMKDGERAVYLPDEQGYVDDPRPSDELRLASVKQDNSNELWSNDEAALLDIGDGVALYEFRSKANSLGRNVMMGLRECIDRVERDPDLRGMVIGNEGKNFSVGANLGEMAMAASQGEFEVIGQYIDEFQDTVQQVRYATKPVVAAPHQRTLGGACEISMACPHPVADAETYIGLVELGVGLIPAGTGTMRMAAKAANEAPNDNPSEIQAHLRPYFETVAMAEVAEGAAEGIEMGFLPETTRIVMHTDRRLYAAKQQVIRLSEQGYMPPPVMNNIKVLGKKTLSTFKVALMQYREGNYISEYDEHLATKLGTVMTGGDLSSPQEVHEKYLLELEREVFLSLLGEQKTQERIFHMLEHNKPLRN